MSKLLKYQASCLLIATACIFARPALAGTEVHTANGIPYVSGGVGTEERDAIDAMKPGTYAVSATMNGKERKQTVQLDANKLQLIAFTWPSE